MDLAVVAQQMFEQQVILTCVLAIGAVSLFWSGPLRRVAGGWEPSSPNFIAAGAAAGLLALVCIFLGYLLFNLALLAIPQVWRANVVLIWALAWRLGVAALVMRLIAAQAGGLRSLGVGALCGAGAALLVVALHLMAGWLQLTPNPAPLTAARAAELLIALLNTAGGVLVTATILMIWIAHAPRVALLIALAIGVLVVLLRQPDLLTIVVAAATGAAVLLPAWYANICLTLGIRLGWGLLFWLLGFPNALLIVPRQPLALAVFDPDRTLHGGPFGPQFGLWALIVALVGALLLRRNRDLIGPQHEATAEGVA